MDADEEVRAFCVHQHAPLVRALALYTGDRGLAEELAQEVLTRVVRDWPRLRRKDSPAAYVHRMAINLANGHYRRRRIADRALQRMAPTTFDGRNGIDHADVLAVRDAVRALPARRRAVVVLRFQAGLSLAEIAAALGVSVGTVKSQLHHALASLRVALETEEEHRAHHH